MRLGRFPPTCVPNAGSKIRIRVPSFGAVTIGCQSGNMPRPPFQTNAEQRMSFPHWRGFQHQSAMCWN